MYLFATLVALLFLLDAGATHSCKSNEVLKKCASPCKPEATCDNRIVTKKTEACVDKCEERCECKEGYIRSKKDGACIKKEDCPVRCGCNEVLNKCASDCKPEATCGDRNPKGRDGDKKCIKRCECKQGYTRLIPNGTCVKSEECPCGKHEVKGCVPCCGRATCGNKNDQCKKKCDKKCNKGCVCKKGYVLEKGRCIPERECPKKQ